MFGNKDKNFILEVQKAVLSIYNTHVHHGPEEFAKTFSKFIDEDSILSTPSWTFLPEKLRRFEIQISDNGTLQVSANGRFRYEGFVLTYDELAGWSCSAADFWGSKATRRAKKLVKVCVEQLEIKDCTDQMTAFASSGIIDLENL